MATLNLGRIKPVFRGAYSGATAYVVDDIVTHGNESFICIQAHGAGTQATSVTAYWTKLAAKGTDGTDIGTTITTQGDILFRDGSGLQRLASSGHGSKTLKMNAGATAPEWTTVVAASSALKKTYHKMFKGGQSFTGHPYQAPTIVPTYQFAITPSSTDSVFLATYNILVGAHSDNTFLKAMAMIDSGSWTPLGRSKSTMDNAVGYYDFGNWRLSASANNQTIEKSHSFYYAPATVSEITFGLFAGQHGSTAYFGRGVDGTTDDYSGVGMTIRVDEYSSSSDLVNTEYTSG